MCFSVGLGINALPWFQPSASGKEIVLRPLPRPLFSIALYHHFHSGDCLRLRIYHRKRAESLSQLSPPKGNKILFVSIYFLRVSAENRTYFFTDYQLNCPFSSAIVKAHFLPRDQHQQNHVRHNGVAHRELMLDVFHDTAQYANNRGELYSSRYDFNDSLHDSVSSTHVP